MKVLVTGGAGFIGSHLVTRLAADGHCVRVLDNFSSGSRATLGALANDVEIIDGDLRDQQAVERAVAGTEVVFHQGAIPSVPKSFADPRSTLDVGITGTLNVLTAARDSGTRRVVFASSSAVYGNNPESPKREDMKPDPLSPYALSKLAGEQLCSMFTAAWGVETVSLRYFNVYGPGQSADSDYAAVIPKFVSSLSRGHELTIYGDGEQSRDFVYIDDVIEANCKAAIADRVSGEILNIGAQTGVTINRLLALLSELTGRAIHSRYSPHRPGDIRDSIADIKKSESILGFTPHYPIAIGIRNLLEFAPSL